MYVSRRSGRAALQRAVAVGVLAATATSASARQAQEVPVTGPVSTASPDATSAAPPALIDGKRTFLPAWFAADRPQTAGDMVSRVPGFSIDNGGDARGFGANAGNVLIDGQRPTTKSEGVGEALGRIAAAAVLRIELLEGAAASALVPGRTLVVNVVRDPNAVSSGNWQAQGELFSDGHIKPELEASYATTVAGWRVNGGLVLDTGYDRLRGFEGLIRPDGTRIEWGPNFDARDNGRVRVSAGAQRRIGETTFATNASLQVFTRERDWTVEATRTGETAVYRRDDGRETGDDVSWEIGADITRPVLGWEARLALLAKGETEDEFSQAGFNRVGAALSYDRFELDSTATEQIARATFKRAFGAHQIELGGEYAFNSLDIETAFSVGDGRSFAVVPGGRGATVVEEARWEAFVADAWTINPRLSLEATLTGEWSTISQTGDATQERSFSYVKPALQLTWRPTDRWVARLGIDRTVGQLDFGAFADSAQVGDGNQNSGNPNLRPEQITGARIAVERRWGRRGVFSAAWIEQRIDDHLTLVRLGADGIGLGNVPEASRHGYDLSATIPLDVIASGLEADFSWRWRNSNVKDPLTGRDRKFDGGNGNNFEAGFRHDLVGTNIRYGAWIWRGDNNRSHRPSQTFAWDTVQFWGVWIERKDFFGMTAELGIETPFGNTFYRRRFDFVPDRATGVLTQYQYRDRSTDGTAYLSLKGTF